MYLAVHWDEAIFILWRSLTKTPRISQNLPKPRRWSGRTLQCSLILFLDLSNQPFFFWSTMNRCIHLALFYFTQKDNESFQSHMVHWKMVMFFTTARLPSAICRGEMAVRPAIPWEWDDGWLPSFPWVGLLLVGLMICCMIWFMISYGMNGWSLVYFYLTPSKLFCPYFQVESKWLQLASTFTFFWDRPLKVVILL